MTIAEKGHFKTTVRIPDPLMRLIEASNRMDEINFNKWMCKAFEHYCACPVENPRQQLDNMKHLLSELHDRTTRLEIIVKKHHKTS